MTSLPTTLTPASRAWPRVQRMLRWIGRGLAVAIGLLIALGLVGASYEALATSSQPFG